MKSITTVLHFLKSLIFFSILRLIIMSCNSNSKSNQEKINNQNINIQNDNEEDKIKKIFKEYVANLYDEKGIGNFDFYSNTFFDEVKNYAELALKTTKQNIYDYSIWDVNFLLSLRQAFSDEELKEKTGREIGEKYVSTTAILIPQNAKLLEIKILNPNKASAKYYMAGNVHNYITFNREEEDWKINIIPSETDKIEKEKEMLKMLGQSKNEGVKILIEMIGGRL
jgi:hypothetical protein